MKKRLTFILAIGLIAIAATIHFSRSAFSPPEEKKFCTLGYPIPGFAVVSIIDWETSAPVDGASVVGRVKSSGAEVSFFQMTHQHTGGQALYDIFLAGLGRTDLDPSGEDVHLHVQKGGAVFEDDYVFRRESDDYCKPLIPDPPIKVIELRRPESTEKKPSRSGS